MIGRGISLKVVFLGDTAVGKSCLAVRFVRNEFFEFQEPTIGAAFLGKTINANDKRYKFEIWDTAGQERYRSLAPMYYRGALAAVVVYDITQRDSLAGAKNWILELKKKVPHCYIILAGNKCDLEQYRKVDHNEVNQIGNELGVDHLLVSAKTNENISKIFHNIANQIKFDDMHISDNTRKPKIHISKAIENNSSRYCCY